MMKNSSVNGFILENIIKIPEGIKMLKFVFPELTVIFLS